MEENIVEIVTRSLQGQEYIRRDISSIKRILAQILSKDRILADTLNDLNTAETNLGTAFASFSANITAEVNALVGSQAAGEDFTPQVENLNNLAAKMASLGASLQAQAPTAVAPVSTIGNADAIVTQTNANTDAANQSGTATVTPVDPATTSQSPTQTGSIITGDSNASAQNSGSSAATS